MRHCLNASRGCRMFGCGGLKQCDCGCDTCMAPYLEAQRKRWGREESSSDYPEPRIARGDQ